MFGQYAAQYADRYHMMYGGDWGWGIFMMLFWLIIAVGIIILVVRFMGQNSSQQQPVFNKALLLWSREKKWRKRRETTVSLEHLGRQCLGVDMVCNPI